MRKRVIVWCLVCLLVLTACGAPAAETPAEPEKPAAEQTAPAPVEEPEPEKTPAEEAPAEEPAEEEPAEEAPVEETPAGPTVEDALAFVDQSVTALYEAIGEPISSSYEYSCSGPGDDGLLTYDGFIVFTYREPDGSAEVVIDAEAE